MLMIEILKHHNFLEVLWPCKIYCLCDGKVHDVSYGCTASSRSKYSSVVLGSGLIYEAWGMIAPCSSP